MPINVILLERVPQLGQMGDVVKVTPEAASFPVFRHNGREADPALGQAFVRAAQRGLAPDGVLWMVANRHLPYQSVLTELFLTVEDAGGDGLRGGEFLLLAAHQRGLLVELERGVVELGLKLGGLARDADLWRGRRLP